MAELSPGQVKLADLAGEKILSILTQAPGNGAPIGGLFHDLSDGVPTAQATALERLTAGLGRIEHFLSPDGFAAGPDFSQADCVLGPSLMGVAAFAGMLGAPDLLTRHPKLAAYAGRVSAHPAVAKVLGELQAAMAANPLPG